MFDDVYDELPWNLKEQKKELEGVVERWSTGGVEGKKEEWFGSAGHAKSNQE